MAVKYGLLVLLILCFFSCSLLIDSDFTLPQEIRIYSNHIILEWQNPAFSEKSNQIHSQRIYIREHGLRIWRHIDEIPYSPTPSYTLNRGDYTPGKYDFGVSIVTNDGVESAIHSSLDYTASPPTGWYIYWVMD